MSRDPEKLVSRSLGYLAKGMAGLLNGPGQHGVQGQEMNDKPPLASILWQCTWGPGGEFVKSHLHFFSVLTTSSISLQSIYLSLLFLLVVLSVMAIARRLSKRRPMKEQPQFAKPQPSTEPVAEETTHNGSTTPLPKNRVPRTTAELDKVAHFCVEDADGNKVPFNSLYEEKPRVLLIFIRHFFCRVRSSSTPYLSQPHSLI